MEFRDTQWRKSSVSTETADCVEVAYSAVSHVVGIRDSKNPTGGVLMTNTPAWEALRRFSASGSRRWL
jgi:hypothetical protein